MREAHLARHRQNLEELGMDRRLAAGELHHAPIHRPLPAQRGQHGANLLHAGLIDVSGDIVIGEAYRASQIAAVGQIDIRQRGVRGMHAAQAAVVRTRGTALDLRIRQPEIVSEVPLLHLEIEFDVAEDDVVKSTVHGT